MKKSVFLLCVMIIALSFNAFGQKKSYHYSNNNNFLTSVFAGIILNEVFDVYNNNYRQMYFSYKPLENSWKIQKNFVKNGPLFYKGNTKVIARFENPYGHRDFFVTIDKRGEWQLKCPKKLAKLFKKKVLKNL